jgi:hypothetical protein
MNINETMKWPRSQKMHGTNVGGFTVLLNLNVIAHTFCFENKSPLDGGLIIISIVLQTLAQNLISKIDDCRMAIPKLQIPCPSKLAQFDV